MHTIKRVAVLSDFCVDLTFDDGVRGIVDLSHHAGEGIFAAWNDPEVFRSARIGAFGELAWGEDIDLCPDALYLEVTGKHPEDVFPNLKRIDAHA